MQALYDQLIEYQPILTKLLNEVKHPMKLRANVLVATVGKLLMEAYYNSNICVYTLFNML